MNKLYTLFKKYRKPFGYGAGAVTVLNGLLELSTANKIMGVFWILLGSLIILDTKEFK